MVELQPSKLVMRVRFPSPAPISGPTIARRHSHQGSVTDVSRLLLSLATSPPRHHPPAALTRPGSPGFPARHVARTTRYPFQHATLITQRPADAHRALSR